MSMMNIDKLAFKSLQTQHARLLEEIIEKHSTWPCSRNRRLEVGPASLNYNFS